MLGTGSTEASRGDSGDNDGGSSGLFAAGTVGLQVVVVAREVSNEVTTFGDATQQGAQCRLHMGLVAMMPSLTCGGMVTHHEDGSSLAACRCEGLRGSSWHLRSGVGDRVRVDRGYGEERLVSVPEARDVARSRKNQSASLVGGIDGFPLQVGIGFMAVFVVAEHRQSGQSEGCDRFVPDAAPDRDGLVARAVDQVSSDTH
jgi:hypothetical protein